MIKVFCHLLSLLDPLDNYLFLVAAIVVDVADLMTEETEAEGKVEELARMKDTPVLDLVMLVNLQLLVGGVSVVPTRRLHGLVFISLVDWSALVASHHQSVTQQPS